MALAILTPHVTVVEGPANGVMVERNDKKLAVYGDPSGKTERVDRVLFTHHIRDVIWVGRGLVERGARAVVPAAEGPLFTGVAAFWDKRRTARFHDYVMETARPPREAFSAVEGVRPGDAIDWEGLRIEVLDARGYTRGAVAYLFEVDGRRIACTGDLIHGDGKILDLYSLQDAIAEPKEDGYHGYGARAGELIANLRAVAARKPDVLVPARGPVIRDPQAAIARLIQRLEAVFASHFEVDALRWYRGDEKLRGMAARILGGRTVEWMPQAALREQLPAWLTAISNARLIVSSSGAAILVDCGNARIAGEVKKLRDGGLFRTLEGIYVSHYHDDHTDYLQAAAEEFRAPVYASRELRDILEHPDAWSMPALTDKAIRSVSVWKEGEVRRWHEFELTSFYFPGQTLYHDALLVKKQGGESIFFIGDSFTPTGIDDYCLLNRNFFDPEKGYSYCLRLVQKLHPDWLVNQHVEPAFHFSGEQIRAMLANLDRCRASLLQLLPWDAPEFGVDHRWARFSPYAFEAETGRPATVFLVILNHSPSARQFRITPRVPAGWSAEPRVISIPARQERTVEIPLRIAAGARGVFVLTADIAYGGWDLREWAEAIVTVR